jgi:hypothetical protein
VERKVNKKKYCISESVERGKGYDYSPSTKEKTSSDEGGDVYPTSSSTHAYHES